MSSRKDDPVFNVKFVQLVESKPCLWNSTLPAYSKKDEIQKAWQEVSNEIKESVRSCRERWRTIRSSFLRSLKLSRTNTNGRSKRKYYLSKYLQFLIPYTKTRHKNSVSSIALRKPAALGSNPPMTRISNMPTVSSDDTKDSSNSAEVAAINEGDVFVSLQEGAMVGGNAINHAPLPLPLPLNLHRIKQENDVASGSSSSNAISVSAAAPQAATTTSTHYALAADIARCTNVPSSMAGGFTATPGMAGNGQAVSSAASVLKTSKATTSLAAAFAHASELRGSASGSGGGAMDFSDVAQFFKTYMVSATPDADQSFLNSLHPYLKEMTGKQNRRFRQKVVALIDAVLDNVDMKT